MPTSPERAGLLCRSDNVDHRAGAAIFLHPDAKGQSLQTENFKYYWALAHGDPRSGVQVVKATEFYDDRDDDSTIWYKHVVPRYRLLPKGELYPGAKLGFTYQSMTVNPLMFLPWIKKVLEARGVRFIRKEVHSIDEAKHIVKCDIAVHASGLGAAQLAGDKDVLPIRGQTMFLETDIDELAMFQGSHYTYIIPRMYSGGAIVGGVSQEGNLDHNMDESLRPDILRRVKRLSMGRLQSLDPSKDSTKHIVAFRPGRKGCYRIEAEGNVVHAYGFGSLGYVYSYGAALKVLELVDTMVSGLDGVDYEIEHGPSNSSLEGTCIQPLHEWSQYMNLMTLVGVQGYVE
ncbi:nucleotide-binding domain-containing protein [Aspergillus parasiticus]|uniref:Nucleotide-binding domain-containing protein n=1 Tax=Aspergillus parasiticus TaxID=5067 RepID=A0A5N6DQG9_ASPPA|nr:nucleotide-binding domain-containing protein [Aspergillus parasiticus]